MDYAELQVTSNYSFLRGASSPAELALAAHGLGHRAFALTDRNTLGGSVIAHAAAKQVGMRFVLGCRLDLVDAPSLLCWPTDRAAYGRLCRLLTHGRRVAPKGQCHLTLADVAQWAEGQVLALVPSYAYDAAFEQTLARVVRAVPLAYIALSMPLRGYDNVRAAWLRALADRHGCRLLATSDVHYHVAGRRPLQDVLTCIRSGRSIDEIGALLLPNSEKRMKSSAEMQRLFAAHPAAIESTLEIVDRCRFNLDELKYEYPTEVVRSGLSPFDDLAERTLEGARWRWRGEPPENVRAQIAHEFELIRRLDYAPYFLTIHDLVRFANERQILCQGRGSAANSAVCFALGITAVDPVKSGLLFERFISAARNEPPDIDIDFEHERREEVIQYVYDKYGRERAGLIATVQHYRPRGALRDVAKAMALSEDVARRVSSLTWAWDAEAIDADLVREAGLDPAEPRIARTMALARALVGFPRHLSQHPGGFVIARGRLDEMVPVENAAMDDRTVIQWDKNDVDALGMMKVDVLAIGMLTVIRKALDLLRDHRSLDLDVARIPAECPKVYDMLGRADSIGVFQVESRAQQSFLPRMKPRCFYDLVIEVAIIRPGPIQGDMVHPYLRRREGKERVEYPSAELANVLRKTLGVPLFQEQAMQIAIVAADFTPDEADQLRRALATFKRIDTIGGFRKRFVGGMLRKGYPPDFAERCFKQIEGFGTYGFPESHAASFALMVYASAWIKCHHPDVFLAAILNSQPLGFYAPAQLVRDAREHGVTVRSVDVNASVWDCTLEADHPYLAVRLGFRMVGGLRKDDAEKIAEVRGNGIGSIDQLNRAGVPARALKALAHADAFASIGVDRRRAIWEAMRLDSSPPPLLRRSDLFDEPKARLRAQSARGRVRSDYNATGLSLEAHPLSFARGEMRKRGAITNEAIWERISGEKVVVGGLVLFRQRPGTAGGTIFITLEDETGCANLIVWKNVQEKFRRATFGARVMGCKGELQREGRVVHVIVEELYDWGDLLHGHSSRSGGGAKMRLKSRDFR